MDCSLVAPVAWMYCLVSMVQWGHGAGTSAYRECGRTWRLQGTSHQLAATTPVHGVVRGGLVMDCSLDAPVAWMSCLVSMVRWGHGRTGTPVGWPASGGRDLKKKKRQETSLVSSQCLLIRWRPYEAPAVNRTILKHSARCNSTGTCQYLETGSRQRG